jgi:hypothetical protein
MNGISPNVPAGDHHLSCVSVESKLSTGRNMKVISKTVAGSRGEDRGEIKDDDNTTGMGMIC